MDIFSKGDTNIYTDHRFRTELLGYEREGESGEFCDDSCKECHLGRNCFHCRKPFMAHFDHYCDPERNHRADFSKCYQDLCDEACEGYHFSENCLFCSKKYQNHYDGHWCDIKKTQRGDFSSAIAVKPAKKEG